MIKGCEQKRGQLNNKYLRQTPGLFHNIGKIHKQILVRFATPGGKFAKRLLQSDQSHQIAQMCIIMGLKHF